MNRIQFRILTGTVVLAAVLFASEIFITRQISGDEQKFVALQRVAQEGNGYYTRWERLAIRTYEGSQKDPLLKEVLTRQQIKITPKTNAGGSSSAPAEPTKVSTPTAPAQPAAKK